ncbi:hypothetical protein Tco_0052705 [Tanacetum coccineum]
MTALTGKCMLLVEVQYLSPAIPFAKEVVAKDASHKLVAQEVKVGYKLAQKECKSPEELCWSPNGEAPDFYEGTHGTRVDRLQQFFYNLNFHVYLLTIFKLSQFKNIGAGGRMSDSFEHEVKDILKCVLVDPPFSLSDLKKAITARCFERSVIRSSYYVVHDLIVAYVFYFLANTYIPLLPTPLAYLASAVILNIFKDRHIIYASSIFSSRKDWV